MNLLNDLIYSENNNDIIKSLWDNPPNFIIPSLIFNIFNSNEETKAISGSILQKIIMNSRVQISSPIIPLPGDPNPSITGTRIILRPPHKINLSSKSITFACHIFIQECNSFEKPILIESLKIFEKILLLKDQFITTRMLLDILSFIPIFFEEENEFSQISYNILEIIKKIGEFRNDNEILICIFSLLELFPKKN